MNVSLATTLGRLGLGFRVENGLLSISWTRYRLLDRDPQTKVILDRLEEKIDLTFEKTSLEDVLKHIKKATSKGQDRKGIPIYVDPVGLLEAEKTLTTPISFTAKGEPLKSSLERLLRSIDLTYVVKDGFLMVTSRSSEDPIPAGGRPHGLKPIDLLLAFLFRHHEDTRFAGLVERHHQSVFSARVSHEERESRWQVLSS